MKKIITALLIIVIAGVGGFLYFSRASLSALIPTPEPTVGPGQSKVTVTGKLGCLPLPLSPTASTASQICYASVKTTDGSYYQLKVGESEYEKALKLNSNVQIVGVLSPATNGVSKGTINVISIGLAK